MSESAKHKDSPALVLGVPGFTFKDLHDPAALARLHEMFVRELEHRAPDAAAKLADLRAIQEDGTHAPDRVSSAILAVAPHVESFVAQLFGVESGVSEKSDAIRYDDPVFAFKREFTKKRVLKVDAGARWMQGNDKARALVDALVVGLASETRHDEERAIAVATLVVHHADDTCRKALKGGGATYDDALKATVDNLRSIVAGVTAVEPELAALFADAPAAADSTEEGARLSRDSRFLGLLADAIEAHLAARLKDPADSARHWPSLHAPHKWNFSELVKLHRTRADLPEELEGPEEHRRERHEPFALTDPRGSMRTVAAHVDYCLYCHDRDKDSCSKGLRDKAGAIKSNPLGVHLHGCPLFEKISEMHALRNAGGVISSLATAMIDNPMLPGTGHRICNDCMKGCVFQTQEPVDIPQVETRILVDVLSLPWGFEIWSFLSRWNPLNVRRPYALPYNGKNVLVVGLGPAGYTLSHHLLNEGFGVVGIDGLKIEPLSARIEEYARTLSPLRDVRELEEPLESRTMLGFGGVSEYGITVRWDKNFLSVLYLNLLRRDSFRVHGGVRFGGTITVEDAWDLGFHHIAIAAGAGKPTLVPMKGNLARGIRQASDLLMGLQLTGAFRRDTLSNLQVRLPALVIGGGLTAIDTATELAAYYVVQIEKTLERFEQLVRERGDAVTRAAFDPEELAVLEETIEHARELRAEKNQAAIEGRAPRTSALITKWGGVSIAYRRTIADSPAYRLNHEEVAKSLEEGIRYIEKISPKEAHSDSFGAVEAVTFERQQLVDGKLVGSGQYVKLPARTVCVAAGTSPNVTYEEECPGTFALDAKGYFQAHELVVEGEGTVSLKASSGPGAFFTGYHSAGRTVSFYGDNHPRYAGSVVRAMASAKDGFPHVARAMSAIASPEHADFAPFAERVDSSLVARVHEVRRLAPSIVEIVVHAPLAARRFRPGQFYRLQNYERHADSSMGTPLLMEGLALTGASTDPERGLLSTIVLEMGASSRMCALLKPGEPVVLMGPTGAPTEIAEGETVLLVGGGLGNAVLFSIARAFKANGARVIYFAGYRHSESVFKRDEIESSTDQVVWAHDAGDSIHPRRPQDLTFRGNIVQAMLAYERGELGERLIGLGTVDRLIAIGSDKMMAAVKDARYGVLKPYMKSHRAIGSINSPMQCMMKQICAQCLQRVRDPVTGKEEVVYTCFNQDLELDHVDFGHLAARLRQNTVQEKLSNMWFDRVTRGRSLPVI